MSFLELIILAVGLSMDAFAVAVCKGLAIGCVRLKDAAIVGAWFGGFQAGMPLIGYLLGYHFSDYISAFDHWIAFGLLALIGGSMIKEALDKDEEKDTGASLACKVMLVMAIATSIDALAVGVTLAFLDVKIIPAVCLIGGITFLLSGVGVKLGGVFGLKYKARAELTGGIILCFLGLKILLEHLGYWPF